MTEALRDILAEEAHRLEVALAPTAITGLVRYFETLARWAGRIRVSGATDALVLIRRHFADSLALARVIPEDHALRCVDVGSGGGLPGLPTALLRPAVRITLVEARARKCAMLRTAIHELGLQCEVVDQRLETLRIAQGDGAAGTDEVRPFDLAWSLATFAPPEWLERGAQLISAKGRVVAFTARPTELACPGLALSQTITYALDDGTPRAIGVYTRT